MLKQLLSAGLTLFALSGFSAQTWAEPEKWYRVELLVFSHRGGESAEKWDATPPLAYPDAARFLVDSASVERNRAAHDAPLTVDEFGRQIVAPRTAMQSAPGVGDNTSAVGAIPAGPEVPSPEPAAVAPILPAPFVTLPAAQRKFSGKAAYMQRSGRYQMLFHEAWVQPVLERADSLPIVLDRSGDTGNWPLLQGSITLYLSRYLHLETALWLNTSGNYLPHGWRMPAPPLGPPSLIIEELPPEEPFMRDSTAPLSRGFGPATPNATLAPVYPFRHAVLLQQQRRMRSEEVHYIDHPMLGLVIELTPLSSEELEAMALDQSSRAGTADNPR